jgi:hypothetical protein
MAKKKTAQSAKIESIRHKDKRANIPTEELRDFVADDEKAPKTMLYPRDPSLDPQLVWKGKDEQDRADLAVPVVPVYIQEKIHPQAIIEDFKRQSADYADSRRLENSDGKNPRKSAQSADQIVVEIKGVDVYDPTTGAIRNSSTDDIACWFIDTDYNGESFFVRHAYFTGADEPYEKLKRALRAEIDEAAWSALYSTTSRPFDRPESGKIAVKVINHYGDEVLKVFEV